MRVETNRIFPANESFPWNGIWNFTQRNKAFLSREGYSLFAFDVHDDEGRNPSDYHAELAFSSPNRHGIVDIYGEIRSQGVLSTMVLDLETYTGEITIPNLGVKVDINGDDFYSQV